MQWRLSAVFFAVICAAMIGCSEKKEESPAPPPKPEPPPAPSEPAPLGEAEFKLPIDEFVQEYMTNSYTAGNKYANKVVELTGTTAKSASVELNSDGEPVGRPGARKATFVLSGPNAKRIETVVVRGLPIDVVGKVFEGQQVAVKGKVAKYKSSQPIELLNAEVVDFGANVTESVSVEKLTGDSIAVSQLAEKCAGRTAMFTATIANRVNEGGIDYIEIENAGQKVRCQLAPGIAAVFSSGLAKGKKVTLAGRLELQKNEAKWWIDVRDCVPVNVLPDPAGG